MPSVNIQNFKGLGKTVAKIVGEKARKTVYNVWWELVAWTPVCSGKAAASWRASAGIPKTFDAIPQPPYAYGEHCYRIHRDPREYTPNVEVLLGPYTRKYTNWFIANSAPYVQYLNEGSSKKAPSGFIQAAVNSAVELSNKGF